MSLQLSVNRRFHLLSLISALSLGVFILFAYSNIAPLRSHFSEYEAQVAKRASLLLDIRRDFGYGGAIHNFKNYVLRGAPKYARRAESQSARLLQEIAAYRSLQDLSAGESKALDTIAATVKAYRDQLARVRRGCGAWWPRASPPWRSITQ